MLKANSKHALQNNWGKAILVLLAPFAVSFIMGIFLQVGVLTYQSSLYYASSGSISGAQDFIRVLGAMTPLFAMQGVFLLVSFFLIGPLQMGAYYWFLQLVKGEAPSAGKVFHFFENFRRYRRALWFNISLSVRQALWMLLFLLVPYLLLFGVIMIPTLFPALARSASFGLMMGMGIIVLVLLFIAAILLVSAYLNKYYLAAYLFVDDDAMTVSQAVKESIEYSKGYRFSLLWFSLSFIGWSILSAFAWPVMFYSMPYMNTAYAMYAQYIIETKRRENPTLLDGPLPEQIPAVPTGPAPYVPTVTAPKEDPLEKLDDVWGGDAPSTGLGIEDPPREEKKPGDDFPDPKF
ncbi:MAG: DUF975 family protein [Oscillospiraceae bacterium]